MTISFVLETFSDKKNDLHSSLTVRLSLQQRGETMAADLKLWLLLC